MKKLKTVTILSLLLFFINSCQTNDENIEIIKNAPKEKESLTNRLIIDSYNYREYLITYRTGTTELEKINVRGRYKDNNVIMLINLYPHKDINREIWGVLESPIVYSPKPKAVIIQEDEITDVEGY